MDVLQAVVQVAAHLDNTEGASPRMSKLLTALRSHTGNMQPDMLAKVVGPIDPSSAVAAVSDSGRGGM